jgi:hypothetical protein
MPLIDPNKNPVGVHRRLAAETDPARRRMLEEVRFHIATEAAGDIEGALQRLSPDPEYALYDHSKAPVIIRGIDAIRTQFYGALVTAIDARLEWDIVRCMVDGNAVITEGQQRNAMRGSTLIQLGIKDADPNGLYLQHARHLVIWPFDSELRLIGETVYFGYSTPPEEIVKHPLHQSDIAMYTGEVLLPS